MSLTKSLRWDIQNLGQRLAVAANEEVLAQKSSSKAYDKTHNELELKRIAQDMRRLLTRIEDAVPLINLAITTSGVSLSTTLPSTISPSRLLQASTFLTAGDTQYSLSPSRPVQIGPAFTLSLYMLFSGHLRPQNEEDIRGSTWKEVIHKARVKLMRVPLDILYHSPMSYSYAGETKLPHLLGNHEPLIEAEGKADEFAYQLIIVEDLDDDRVHTFEETELQPGPYGEVKLAGIREMVPIHEISKIFYADTGKILNIGNDNATNSPVLLLKRDINAIAPRRMMERFSEDNNRETDMEYQNVDAYSETDDYDTSQSQIDAQFDRENRSSSVIPPDSPPPAEPLLQPDPWRFPPGLDPEWIAFEVYTEPEDSDTESEHEPPPSTKPSTSRSPSIDPNITSALTNLDVNDTSTPASHQPYQIFSHSSLNHTNLSLPPIRTSLSLLETLLRLLSLQQFQQTSHLSIPDELLNFFLTESATTGAANGDEQERRRLRNEARKRVGFDPYDESPIKRRGEEYQYRGGESQAGWAEHRQEWNREYRESPISDQIYDVNNSSAFDEGYDSRRISTPNHAYSHYAHHHDDRASPFRTQPPPPPPPLLLKDRAYSSSRTNTPDRATSMPPPLRRSSTSSGIEYPSPRTPPTSFAVKSRSRHLKMDDYEEKRSARRGSPLAKKGDGGEEGESGEIRESVEGSEGGEGI